MWVSKEITESNRKNFNLKIGKVTQTSENEVCIENDTEYRNLPIVCPYGFFSIPVLGSNAVIAPISNNFLYFGTKTKNLYDLKSGEVGMYSHGGASIVLKNDGRVLINGNPY